jgi:hypothetical protein
MLIARRAPSGSLGDSAPHSRAIVSSGEVMRSHIAPNNSALSRKCQYTAPRVTPAAAATSASEVRVVPRSRNTRSAATSSRSRVARASSLVRRTIVAPASGSSPLYKHS